MRVPVEANEFSVVYGNLLIMRYFVALTFPHRELLGEEKAHREILARVMRMFSKEMTDQCYALHTSMNLSNFLKKGFLSSYDRKQAIQRATVLLLLDSIDKN